jgi:pimeloyl-ACP methyl ester carboxylesterase
MLKAPQIRFCRASDGVRIAYATTGRGPAMIEVATWLNHLEFDWQSPVWRPRLVELAKNYNMTRYDGRGCGLSDRAVEDLSFDANLRDLEAVADAAGFKRFILLGCCQGSGLAIAYAARHPERVSNLVLYGAFARGRLKRNPSARDLEEADMMLKLVELGWGRENPAFRQVYTTMFIPESTPEQFRWFTDLQRMSTSPENAVGLIRGFDAMDVTELLPKVSCPTLVLHARNDASRSIRGRPHGCQLDRRRGIRSAGEPQSHPVGAAASVETVLGRDRPVRSRSRPAGRFRGDGVCRTYAARA